MTSNRHEHPGHATPIAAVSAGVLAALLTMGVATLLPVGNGQPAGAAAGGQAPAPAAAPAPGVSPVTPVPGPAR